MNYDATTSQLYIQLLERANNQLALWSNPYGVLVAVLSFLVTFLAIIFAYILWRQSEEYKKAFREFWAEARDNTNTEMKETLSKALDVAKKELTEKLTTETGESLTKIKAEISNLDKTKKDINDPKSTYYRPFSSVTSNANWLGSWNMTDPTSSVTSVYNPLSVYPAVGTYSVGPFPSSQSKESEEIKKLKAQVAALEEAINTKK